MIFFIDIYIFTVGVKILEWSLELLRRHILLMLQ